MKRQSTTQAKSVGRFFLFALALIATGCANSATNSADSTSSSLVASSTLAIVPSVVTLTAGTTYNFSASGGSGSGYTFSMPSGTASVGSISSAGYYYAGTSAGTGSVLVTDSAGNAAYATVTITSSSGSTSTSVQSITGTLTHCVGVVGGSYSQNNWQVNGTELRTINDPNYSQESPVNCSGLSVAGQIPTTATIVGVTVGIYLINQTNAIDGSLLQTLNLINSNVVLGSMGTLNLQIPGNTATFPTFTQGSSSTTWGASLTPAIVNSSTFGVSIQTFRSFNRLFTGDATSNMPTVTIYYSI